MRGRLTAMPEGVLQPRLEGSVKLPDGRRLGYAEFGTPTGTPLLWFHGTPGARRQVPPEARRIAAREGLRIIGVDRPGIGSSTPHLYGSIADHVADLEALLDRLGVDEVSIIALSGGGPYALASGAAMSDRVRALAVLGGVAPTVGADSVGGGIVDLARRFSPVITRARGPLAAGLGGFIRMARPMSTQAISLYARLSPEGDRELLNQPEFRAMFIDDLINGSRKRFAAPISDVVLFGRYWGFDLDDVKVPVRWWHGDSDHIVPFEHGRHVVSRLPEAEMHTLEGKSHLGGLGADQEVLRDLLDLLG